MSLAEQSADRDPSGTIRFLAWCVHLFTASGAVLGGLALLAIHEARYGDAILLMLATLVIDSVDGTFARKIRVAEVVLSFGISVVYKAMRMPSLEGFWRQVTIMTSQIILYMIALAIVLVILVQVVIPRLPAE